MPRLGRGVPVKVRHARPLVATAIPATATGITIVFSLASPTGTVVPIISGGTLVNSTWTNAYTLTPSWQNAYTLIPTWESE